MAENRFPADSSMINGAPNQGFEHNVRATGTGHRVYALLDVEEAQALLEMAEEKEDFGPFINRDSMLNRLSLAADGQPAPEAGTQAFYE